jgi:predicted dithiol-disulfide oxidoreductase (DUF899 family)
MTDHPVVSHPEWVSPRKRVLENFIGAHNLLDNVPKGRDESVVKDGMEAIRRHHQYQGGST